MNTSREVDLRYLFLLRPDIIFLNHGSFGACPRPVFEEYQYWQLELERQPVEFLGRRFEMLMREAREALARYVHASPDEVVFVPNATTGINIVARSLRLNPGDEILSTNHEYGALDRTWRFVCQQGGCRYINRPVAVPIRNREEVIEQVWSGVTPRTRVLFISHITSPTAIIFPVHELLRRARKAGLITIVDGAHTVGQIPLDLEELGADFYSSNAHKWLLAPKGSAFLYARRELQHLLEPLVVSWGWETERPSESRFIDEQEWTGTRDIAAYLAVPAAIEFLRQHNWERAREQCHQLARYARQKISQLTGLASLTPDSSEWYAQMVSLPLPACDADLLKRRLYDDFRIEVPIVTWNKQQFVRVSVQAYNNREDIEALVHALSVLLPAVG